MRTTQQYLEKLPFWEQLTDSQKDRALRSTQIRSYEAGSVIHAHDHECLGLVMVLSGKVRTFMLSEEGREVTLYQMEAGDTDVLSASCVLSQVTFETMMVADTMCELLVLPAAVLSEFKDQNLAARCYIYERLGSRFSDTMGTMQRVLFMPIDSRIASCLLEISRKEGSDLVRMTHEQIAREINSSREVVSRMVKRFEEEGLVELQRGKIRILDAEGLDDHTV